MIAINIYYVVNLSQRIVQQSFHDSGRPYSQGFVDYLHISSAVKNIIWIYIARLEFDLIRFNQPILAKWNKIMSGICILQTTISLILYFAFTYTQNMRIAYYNFLFVISYSVCGVYDILIHSIIIYVIYTTLSDIGIDESKFDVSKKMFLVSTNAILTAIGVVYFAGLGYGSVILYVDSFRFLMVYLFWSCSSLKRDQKGTKSEATKGGSTTIGHLSA